MISNALAPHPHLSQIFSFYLYPCDHTLIVPPKVVGRGRRDFGLTYEVDQNPTSREASEAWKALSELVRTIHDSKACALNEALGEQFQLKRKSKNSGWFGARSLPASPNSPSSDLPFLLLLLSCSSVPDNFPLFLFNSTSLNTCVYSYCLDMAHSCS